MDLKGLSDAELVVLGDDSCRRERAAILDMLCCLAEISSRRCYRELGYNSLFDLCVRRWRYARPAAARRAKAARALSKYPEIAVWMRDGDLSLSAVAALEPYLEKHGPELLHRAVGKTLDVVYSIIAEIDPKGDSPDSVRVVSVRKTESSSQTTDGVAQTADEVRVEFKFTASGELKALIERAKDILWHKYPVARLEDVLLEAMRLLIAEIDPLQHEPSKRDFSGSDLGRIPQALKEAVLRRDEGKCTWRAPDGTVCGSTRGVEVDHIVPRAKGGSSIDLNNLRTLCCSHNQLAAEQEFGELMSRTTGRAARPPS